MFTLEQKAILAVARSCFIEPLKTPLGSRLPRKETSDFLTELGFLVTGELLDEVLIGVGSRLVGRKNVTLGEFALLVDSEAEVIAPKLYSATLKSDRLD